MQGRVEEYAQLRLAVETVIPQTVGFWYDTVIVPFNFFYDLREVQGKFLVLKEQMIDVMSSLKNKYIHLNDLVNDLVNSYNMEALKEYRDIQEEVKLLAEICTLEDSQQETLLAELNRLQEIITRAEEEEFKQLEKEEDKIFRLGICDLNMLVKECDIKLTNITDTLKELQTRLQINDRLIIVISAMLVLLELINVSKFQENVFNTIFKAFKLEKFKFIPVQVQEGFQAEQITNIELALEYHTRLIELAWFPKREVSEGYFLSKGYQYREFKNSEALMFMCFYKLDKLTLEEQHVSTIKARYAILSFGVDFQQVLCLKPYGNEDCVNLRSRLKTEAEKEKPDFPALAKTYIASLDWLYDRFKYAREMGYEMDNLVIRAILEACLYTLTVYLEALVNYKVHQKRLKKSKKTLKQHFLQEKKVKTYDPEETCVKDIQNLAERQEDITTEKSDKDSFVRQVQPIAKIHIAALEAQVNSMKVKEKLVSQSSEDCIPKTETREPRISKLANSTLFGQGQKASSETKFQKETIPSRLRNSVLMSTERNSRRPLASDFLKDFATSGPKSHLPEIKNKSNMKNETNNTEILPTNLRGEEQVEEKENTEMHNNINESHTRLTKPTELQRARAAPKVQQRTSLHNSSAILKHLMEKRQNSKDLSVEEKSTERPNLFGLRRNVPELKRRPRLEQISSLSKLQPDKKSRQSQEAGNLSKDLASSGTKLNITEIKEKAIMEQVPVDISVLEINEKNESNNTENVLIVLDIEKEKERPEVPANTQQSESTPKVQQRASMINSSSILKHLEEKRRNVPVIEKEAEEKTKERPNLFGFRRSVPELTRRPRFENLSVLSRLPESEKVSQETQEGSRDVSSIVVKEESKELLPSLVPKKAKVVPVVEQGTVQHARVENVKPVRKSRASMEKPALPTKPEFGVKNLVGMYENKSKYENCGRGSRTTEKSNAERVSRMDKHNKRQSMILIQNEKQSDSQKWKRFSTLEEGREYYRNRSRSASQPALRKDKRGRLPPTPLKVRDYFSISSSQPSKTGNEKNESHKENTQKIAKTTKKTPAAQAP